MLSERVYRWLLVVYPREHRREYGELMVQLFRDRMRRDGGGFRGLVVWMQMIFDLVGAAFKEHKEGTEMTKRRIWIGAGLVAMLLAGVVGASTILAQSKGVTVISTAHDFKTFSDDGAGEVAEAVRQAVEEGAIDQEAADEIVRVFNERRAASSAEEAEEMMVSVRHDSRTFSGQGTDALDDALRQAVGEGAIDQETADGIAWALDKRHLPPTMWRHYFSLPEVDVLTEAMRQAVEEGVIAQETADRIVHGFDGDSPSDTWRHYSFVGVDRFAEALRQAVEEGLITQETADRILQSLDDENVQ